MIGLAIVLVIVFVAVFAPLLAPHSTDRAVPRLCQAAAGLGRRRQLDASRSAPIAVGRDMLSRIIYGARISLFIGLAVMVVSTDRRRRARSRLRPRSAASSTSSSCASWISSCRSRALVLAILIIAVIGPNLTNTIVAVTIVYLPRYVRLVARLGAVRAVARTMSRRPKSRASARCA